MNALISYKEEYDALSNSSVLEQLENYNTHSLKDLKNAELMNRVDTKFLLHKDMLPELLNAMRHHFTLLEINNKNIFSYRSTYYDTEKYCFYHMHHRGQLNRHKVRVREYLDSHSKFIEIKFKNNKKRTIKTRLEIPTNRDINIDQFRGFLLSNGIRDLTLKPKQISEYFRIALASEKRKERVTLDLNIKNLFKGSDSNNKVHLEDLAIIEVKQEKHDRNSPFFSFIKNFGLRPSSFSKYCMGMVYTAKTDKQSIKTNRFKHICRKVDNIHSHHFF